MTDDKRRDDDEMELGEKSSSSLLDNPSSPQPPRSATSPFSSYYNSAALPILSYCASSILMTVTNKYVLSGRDYDLNFLLLCVQVSSLWSSCSGSVC